MTDQPTPQTEWMHGSPSVEARIADIEAHEAQAHTEALDVEALRQAIYETSVAHDWENTIDRDDRTAEIASRYAAVLAAKADR